MREPLPPPDHKFEHRKRRWLVWVRPEPNVVIAVRLDPKNALAEPSQRRIVREHRLAMAAAKRRFLK